MPVDLSGLSDADRADFTSRLDVYGLDESVVQQEIRVQPNSRVPLTYGAGRDTLLRPTVVRVADFDQLNSMIGVNDRLFERIPPDVPLPQPFELAPGGGLPRLTAAVGLPRAAAPRAEGVRRIDIDALEPQQLDNVRTAARAFLRGNSELVASFKPIIEHTIGTVELPVWPLLYVRVADGSTLEFGPGINVLVAYDIEIEGNGRIVSKGHLTVNATKLRKTGAVVIGPGPVVQPVVRRTIFD